MELDKKITPVKWQGLFLSLFTTTKNNLIGGLMGLRLTFYRNE